MGTSVEFAEPEGIARVRAALIATNPDVIVACGHGLQDHHRVAVSSGVVVTEDAALGVADDQRRVGIRARHDAEDIEVSLGSECMIRPLANEATALSAEVGGGH